MLTDATKTIEAENASSNVDEELHSILKQIELDVNRTMPGHKLFDDGAEGGVKLRRILVAYSIHINRAIGKCFCNQCKYLKCLFDLQLTSLLRDPFDSLLPRIQFHSSFIAERFRGRRRKVVEVSREMFRSSGLFR